LGRAGRDPDARFFHLGDLFLGAALAARDDGTGMAHTAARRRRAARDEAGHRLLAAALGLVDRELGGFLFGRAADFADHDHRLGLVVGEEQLEHVDEVGAVDGVAADAHRGGLAQAGIGGLEHRLIS
ncbi:hypothetical protein QU38_00075, partial [Staphylococcus aureus]